MYSSGWAAHERWAGVSLAERTSWVLRGVAEGKLSRDWLYGDLAPWTLDGRSIAVELSLLAILGLVALDPLGPSAPTLTSRGRRVLAWITN